MATGGGILKTLRRDQGAAAVELALVLPMLLLLLFGMVDFARGFNAHLSASGAAREGVRAYVLKLSDPDWQQRTVAAAPSLSTTLTPTLVTACPAGATDEYAEVHATHDLQLVTPVSAFMAMFGGSGPAGSITLTGIGVMRCGG